MSAAKASIASCCSASLTLKVSTSRSARRRRDSTHPKGRSPASIRRNANGRELRVLAQRRDPADGAGAAEEGADGFGRHDLLEQVRDQKPTQRGQARSEARCGAPKKVQYLAGEIMRRLSNRNTRLFLRMDALPPPLPRTSPA